MSDFVLELQLKTGVKLLWNTCNLFAHPRFVGRLPQNRIFRSFFLYYYIIIYYSYSNGAATNPDAHVVAYAAAQD